MSEKHDVTLDDLETSLLRVPLFADLSREDLRRIATLAEVRTYAAGELILNEGDPARSFYVILRGDVVIRRSHSPTPVHSKLHAGDYFGEMSLLDGLPRSASVQAIMSVECLEIRRWDFLKELRNRPEIAVQMLPGLSKRVRRAEGDDAV